MTLDLSRRTFLKSASAVAASSLVVGYSAQGALASASGAGQLTPFVRISADGTVTAIVKHYDSGQGTATGLASLIAEELNMPLDKIAFEFAPANTELYKNLFFGMQGTGGSTAMANSFMQYRTAGAAAREMLTGAAAKAWGVDPGAVSIADGMLVSGDKSAPMSDFVAAASQMAAPEAPALKDPAEFTVIGNTAAARVDNQPKITGQAKYAMDMQLDGQIVAVILRSPRFGGKLVSFDDSGAQGMPGYIRAAALPTGKGVIVYADKTWAAFQARDAITAEWDDSGAEMRSSDQINADLMAMLDRDAEFNVKGAPGDAAMEGAAQVVESDFYVPMLAHAPMEPMGCTIAPTETGVVLYDGSQFPTAGQMTLAAVLQIKPEQVAVETLYAGGSFGRRATPDADYLVEAALAFALNGGQSPVKLVWSREDDITGGYYRPAFAHKVRVGLDGEGKITAWDHRIAGQSIFKGTGFEQMVVQNGVDHSSVEGVSDTPYALPGMYVGLTDNPSAVPVNWWRSVGHTHTALAMEVMMDMAADAAGADPVAFRLGYLGGDTPDHKRLSSVLKLAAEKAGWGKDLPDNHAQGVAVHKSFGSYVAEVVEISRDDAGDVQIEKVTCAVDCGIAVNPDVVIAQMESAIGYGLGHAMRDAITLSDGVVDQSNFPDFEPLRISDIAAIETFIVPSTEAPSGVGEPGTPPSVPALINALAKFGDRPTHFPLTEHGVSFV